MLKRETFKRYEFADGCVVCVKGFSKDELAREEKKHGALRKIGQKLIFRPTGGADRWKH